MIEKLYEEPLRAQVWMSQIQSNLWVRNGWSVTRLENTYHACKKF